MIGNQRWLFRVDSYRPPAETIKTQDYEVAPIEDDNTAKDFVIAHHYSGSYPAARFRFGLYRGATLEGVAVFSHPCRDAVLTNVFPGRALDAVELGRFVLLDSVKGNGETWFLGRCFELLRKQELRGVVSFSDPFPRNAACGRVVFPGHVGTIYQAHNAFYLGRGTQRTLRLLPNGLVFSDRAISKIRSGERGWLHSAATLVEHGATAPTCLRSGTADPDELRDWLPRALDAVTRPMRHPGNHKYAWPLARKVPMRAGKVHPPLLLPRNPKVVDTPNRQGAPA